MHCSISGYGPGGPYPAKEAHELLVQCEAGLVSVTGAPETPAEVGVPGADIAARMCAYTGILTALIRGQRTREGATLEISMLEALAEWMGFPFYYATYGGVQPPRTGASHSAIALCLPFACGDGQQVFLGIHNEREWTVFCERVLARPELTHDDRFGSNSRRVADRDGLAQAIHDSFRGLDSDQVVQRLDAAAIAYARLRDLHELGYHPQIAARSRWTQVDSPAGPLRAIVSPATIDGDQLVMGRIPNGEHTAAILAELGHQPEATA